MDDAGKPVIGIIDTRSGINPYHTHLKDRVEDIRRGVAQASGFPIVLPALSLSERFVVPSTTLYRDPLATECEELMRP